MPKPLGLNQRTAASGQFGLQQALYSGTGWDLTPGIGIVGTKVRVWGRVTDVSGNSCWIDDGTGLKSDVSGERTGIRVIYDSATPLAVGDMVAGVTGVLGAEMDDASPCHPVPVIRCGRISVNITTPPDGTISKAPGVTTVTIAGEASDDDTGIFCVQVGFTATGSQTPPTTWYPATSYDDATHVWTYSWSSPQTQRIWVRATNFDARTATTSRDVTVSSVTKVAYVRPGGTGTKDGSSWDNAEDKVGDALNVTGVTEVWVAQGTYTEYITLKSGVGVYGGFSPTTPHQETFREERNWAANVTTLDGNHSRSVVTIPSWAASGTTIDGFTIRNGYAVYGGGIYIDGSYGASATVANNIIRANNSTGYGGGLCVHSSNSTSASTITIVGNVFVGNTSDYFGGGIDYGNIPCQIVKIANNTIIGNVASTDGGGIYLGWSCGNPANVSVSNNIIAYNFGGGVWRASSDSPNLTRNDVYGNDTNGKYNYSFSPFPSTDIQSPPLITNIDWGDWHIASGSPCRDPQNIAVVVPMDRDIDGESWSGSRVNGTAIDIGADEWNGTDPIPMTTPRVFYVSPAGGGDRTGTSWANAADKIQTAIDAASLVGGGEVWVATGIYAKRIGDASVANVKSFVKLYGGFAVGDSSKSARNWRTNPTILDGGASGSVATMRNAVSCVIDGFTIRNGAGMYSSSSSYHYGGGIYCSNVIATIENNIIRANSAGSASYGGGLYASASLLTLAGNVFVADIAGFGGGIYYTNTSGQIANNTIIGNMADDCGGIYLESSSPALSNNIVYSNVGGGIYRPSGSPGSPTFTKDDVCGNNANGKYEYSWTPTYPVGADLIPVDPVIPNADYHDWHIAQTSPCRDPHDTTLAVQMDKDMDVQSRIYGSTVDIGADEWSGTDPTPVTGCCRVGFMYHICTTSSMVNTYVENYLGREEAVHPGRIAYSRIGEARLGLADHYDVVIVACPNNSTITPSVITALKAFVDSGRTKRIVLVGDYNPTYAFCNINLNTLAEGIGMNSRFTESRGYSFDNGPNTDRHCTVEHMHYLMDGVSWLWDAATDYFIDSGSNAWNLWARPLAYVYDSSASTQPWIIEEDTATAGSRIAIHDSNIFWGDFYSDTYDTIPDKNFKFIFNLCTIFPQ